MWIGAYYFLPDSFAPPLDKPKLFRYPVDNLLDSVTRNNIKLNITPPDFSSNVNPRVLPP